MKKLIEFLFSGCWHEWETIDVKKYRQSLTYDSGRSKECDVMVYTLRCKKCGEIKSTEI
jgi:hypothetical protein